MANTNTTLAALAATAPRDRIADQRLRVAHIIHDFEIGGSQRLLLDYARRADRTRFDLSFISLGPDGPIGEQLRQTDWPVYWMDYPSNLNPWLVFDLAMRIRKLRPSVVHTHDIRPLIYGTPAAILAGVRGVIQTRHGKFAELSPRQQKMASILARWTKHFVCVSGDASDEAKRQGIPPARVRTIWNGIDLQRFEFCGARSDGPVLAVGRLSHEKDHQTLVRAIGIAAREDSNLQLQIAGDGPCRAELEDLTVALKISDRVRLVGEVIDVADFLSRGSLLVQPSKTEGIPLAVLEAQAVGLPVIATHVGGNAEVILDGKTGALTPASDPRAMARSILALRADPALCAKFSRDGRLRVEEEFNVDRMIHSYEKLYMEGRR